METVQYLFSIKMVAKTRLGSKKHSAHGCRLSVPQSSELHKMYLNVFSSFMFFKIKGAYLKNSQYPPLFLYYHWIVTYMNIYFYCAAMKWHQIETGLLEDDKYMFHMNLIQFVARIKVRDKLYICLVVILVKGGVW